MFALLIIIVILTMAALLIKQWGLALGLYLLSGVLWVRYDDKRPSSLADKPMYLDHPIYKRLMVLIWPLRAFILVQEFLYFRNHPERFTVLYSSSADNGEYKYFKTFEESLSFARSKAKEFNAKESGLDLSDEDEENLSEEDFDNLLRTSINTFVMIHDAATHKRYNVYSSEKIEQVL